MARNGFSSDEQRKKAQEAYEKTEKGKLARAKANARNGTKRFIQFTRSIKKGITPFF